MKQLLILALTIISLSSCSGIKNITSTKKNFDFPAYTVMERTSSRVPVKDSIYTQPAFASADSNLADDIIIEKPKNTEVKNQLGSVPVAPDSLSKVVSTTDSTQILKNARAQQIKDKQISDEELKDKKQSEKAFFIVAGVVVTVIVIVVFVAIVGAIKGAFQSAEQGFNNSAEGMIR